MNLALFLPKDTSFYRNLFTGMHAAFANHGVSVYGGCGLLEPDEMYSFCEANSIDVVFEMNRSRSKLPKLPKRIIHIGWLVDLWGDFSSYLGSDIMYVFVQPWKQALEACGEVNAKWLYPAADRNSYFRSDEQPDYKSDFAFLGHIPAPYSESELNRHVKTVEDRDIDFRYLYNKSKKTKDELGGFYQFDGMYPNMIDFILDNPLKYKRFGTLIEDPKIKYDVEIRTVRMFLRQELIDVALKVSDSIRIFGSENWTKWDKYKNFYHHFLEKTDDIKDVYHSSKINLHDGAGMHFRSLDCMASGGALGFYTKFSKNSLDRDIFRFFRPWKDFIPMNPDKTDKIKRYLADDELRMRMTENAHDKIISEHTWDHRVESILHDISRL